MAEIKDPALFGRDLFGEPVVPEGRSTLAARFEFPPFSVLNAREGEWQDRKRAWLEMGIKSELGREQLSTTVCATDWMKRGNDEGGSVFDPVLTELCYRWFCPPGGQVVDPFAGGSVRGLVAGLLGFRYHGIDLSARQLFANREQKEALAPEADVQWMHGDSGLLLRDAPRADFIFSCPPYGDLERYSDDPSDLSTMEYADFVVAYRAIIAAAAERLRPNRMACFVVGDFRDKRTGYYRGFVADTILAFRDAGLALYNDAILVTAVGSLPIRVSGQFEGGRKLGKTHQNVLVFAKGDPRLAFKGDTP